MEKTPGKGLRTRTAHHKICEIHDSQLALTKNDEEPIAFPPLGNEADRLAGYNQIIST
jgi:hypothetical protein